MMSIQLDIDKIIKYNQFKKKNYKMKEDLLLFQHNYKKTTKLRENVQLFVKLEKYVRTLHKQKVYVGFIKLFKIVNRAKSIRQIFKMKKTFHFIMNKKQIILKVSKILLYIDQNNVNISQCLVVDVKNSPMSYKMAYATFIGYLI